MDGVYTQFDQQAIEGSDLIRRRKENMPDPEFIHAAFDGGVNRWGGRAQVEGVLTGPFAGAFLLGFVQNQVDDSGAGLRVAP